MVAIVIVPAKRDTRGRKSAIICRWEHRKQERKQGLSEHKLGFHPSQSTLGMVKPQRGKTGCPVVHKIHRKGREKSQEQSVSIFMF